METEPERLREAARTVLESPETEAYFSAVSGWELAIKNSLGRLSLPRPPAALVGDWLAQSEMRILPLTLAHALRVAELPPHHGDPIDRLLVAQAQIEGLAILTADPAFEPYEVETLWAQ
jgi:PIN domain nuclease of toxin-antitoxin system